MNCMTLAVERLSLDGARFQDGVEPELEHRVRESHPRVHGRIRAFAPGSHHVYFELVEEHIGID